MSAPVFKVGDKVVCIDATCHPAVWEYATRVPQVGHIYTVRAVHPNCRNPATGERGTGYWLEELRTAIAGSREIAWAGCHFKAVAELSADERRQLACSHDRNQLSRFKQALDSGADFSDLPPDLKAWWLNRY